MTGAIVRIILRYGSGALVAKGILSPDDGAIFAADPDVAQMLQVGIGAAIGAATEVYYAIAKRMGWAT